MKTLHIAPGDSAAGSLIQAIRHASLDDDVLPFLDDLSCGPIASDDPLIRAIWWSRFYDKSKVEADLREFWERVTTTEDRLVIWVSRHSAREFALFLAVADRLEVRSYGVNDVTARRLPTIDASGSTILSRPVQSVSTMQSETLELFLGQEQPIAPGDRDESMNRWRQLRTENAPFRIITEAGLISASIDHFDGLLLEQTTTEWQPANLVIHNTIGYNSEPYYQVGDVMLRDRIASLVEQERLLADQDPWTMSCKIKLPG